MKPPGRITVRRPPRSPVTGSWSPAWPGSCAGKTGWTKPRRPTRPCARTPRAPSWPRRWAMCTGCAVTTASQPAGTRSRGRSTTIRRRAAKPSTFITWPPIRGRRGRGGRSRPVGGTRYPSAPGPGRAMIELPLEADVRGPAEKVFDLITDFGGQDRWLAKSSSFRGTTLLSSGPVGLGSDTASPSRSACGTGRSRNSSPPRRSPSTSR